MEDNFRTWENLSKATYEKTKIKCLGDNYRILGRVKGNIEYSAHNDDEGIKLEYLVNKLYGYQ